MRLERIALGLTLSIERLVDGWEVECSGSLLVIHWRFIKRFGANK